MEVDPLVSVATRAGQGSPTIILEAGLGDDASVWREVMPALASDHLVVAINRPGHGTVPETDARRDPCSIAAGEHDARHAAGIPRPFVLVGHSLGGRYAYVYAKQYPEDVAGLVLVDATPPDHWQHLQSDAPDAVLAINALRMIAFSPTDRREFDDQDRCMNRVDMSRSLTILAKVLVAGKFRPGEAGAFQHVMERTREQWKRLAGVPTLQVVETSSHYIQPEAPQAVIAAVQAIARP